MATLDSTTGAALLKKMYPVKVMEKLTFTNRPFLAMVPKGVYGGSSVDFAIHYSDPQGIATDLADVTEGPSGSKQFSATMRSIEASASVDGKLIEKCAAGDPAAFVDPLKDESSNLINSVSNVLAAQLYRTAGGALGKVSSVTATTLVLTNPSDAVNFPVGMYVGADTVDGGGTVHSGSEPITKVDANTGILTAAAWTDITGIAAGDFLFRHGTYDTCFHGQGSWVAKNASDVGTLLGVDRTVDVESLGGLRVSSSDVSGLPIEQKLQHGLMRCAIKGASPDKIFLNPVDYNDLIIELGSKVQYTEFKVGVVGFGGVRMNGPTGEVMVVADRFCPVKEARINQMNTWKLLTTSGGTPKFLDLDGRVARAASSYAYSFRAGIFGNLICTAPGFNCVVDLS